MTHDALASIAALHSADQHGVPGCVVCADYGQGWGSRPPDPQARRRRSDDVERLAEAMLNESDRQSIEGDSYPKGWRGRAERLAAEYSRLAALDAKVEETP